MKHALMIAFHYPPQKGSSGLQRTLKFSQYLGRHGRQPLVLTVHPRAHRDTSDDLLAKIPPGVPVRRAFTLDTMRHLSIAGRYPGWLALPDQWVSWIFGGVPAGLRMIRQYRPGVIWSTFPIATAHLIGLILKRLTGLPWVADFRDPMVEGDYYPADPVVRRCRLWIERKTMRHADVVIVTTDGLAAKYGQMYPQADIRVLPNGYDEDDFPAEHAVPVQRDDQPLKMLHSGLLYPHERNPEGLFIALQRLKKSGRLSADNLQIGLRATGHDRYLQNAIEEHGIGDLVTLLPAVDHADALEEMMSADGLLIMQAASCNEQIPAKLYEYLRARRPILALTDRAGDTGKLLLGLDLEAIAPLDDAEKIAAALMTFVERIRQGRARIATAEQIAGFSRQAQTESLAGIFAGLDRRSEA